MDKREERFRQRAYRLWEEEGGADRHWVQADEIIAIEDGQAHTLKRIETAEAEPVELTNLGEFPTLADQGEMEIPHRGKRGRTGQPVSWST